MGAYFDVIAFISQAGWFVPLPLAGSNPKGFDPEGIGLGAGFIGTPMDSCSSGPSARPLASRLDGARENRHDCPMSAAFLILMSIAMLAVLAVLMLGIFSMAKGGEFNKKYGNKLMRARVILQGVALALFVLAVLTLKKR